MNLAGERPLRPGGAFPSPGPSGTAQRASDRGRLGAAFGGLLARELLAHLRLGAALGGGRVVVDAPQGVVVGLARGGGDRLEMALMGLGLVLGGLARTRSIAAVASRTASAAKVSWTAARYGDGDGAGAGAGDEQHVDGAAALLRPGGVAIPRRHRVRVRSRLRPDGREAVVLAFRRRPAPWPDDDGTAGAEDRRDDAPIVAPGHR